MKLYNYYTYAFLSTPPASLELPVGIGEQVLLVSSGGVSALVEPGVPIESLQNDDSRLMQAILSHDRVICELFRQTTLLPLRFGTSFTSKKSLLTHLRSHGSEYSDKLRQLNGKVEYILKFIPLTPDEATIPAEVGGRQYFLAKKQRYKTQQEFQVAQRAEWKNATEAIALLYNSAIIAEPQDSEARIYLLVSRQDSSLLAEEFLYWQQACPRWELQLGEALPPYHFI